MTAEARTNTNCQRQTQDTSGCDHKDLFRFLCHVELLLSVFKRTIPQKKWKVY